MARRKKRKSRAERRVYELRKGDGAWRLKSRGGLVVLRLDGDRKAAIQESAKWVREKAPSQMVIFTANGRISEERTYGGDPQRRKG